ncbi:uncharacterized protein LOC134617143 [Pelmatolapia mariae]|uniref:uncharacterized protein LOC134617143 n=1 Tax=Pelmatolapia mariae TaxID=158779 RepID=UPI003211D49B
MKGKILLVLLLFWPGVCPLSFQEVNVKAGEMAVLQCPSYRGYSDGGAEVLWTSDTVDEMKLFNMSTSAEQRQMGVLVHGRILVILRASVNHQGNYSCSFRNSSRRSWINLRVYTMESKESGKMIQDSKTCYTDKSCTLYCHDENILFDTWNITRNSTTCHKEGEPSPKDGYFSNSTVVIDCKAVMLSDTDELFWLSSDSFVETNSSLPVFYNYTWVNSTEEINMTASLVFRQVSEEDLSNNYTCKLQSDYETNFVTITLKQNETFIPPMIISPKNNQEFDVDLDSTVVIDCKAVTSSDTDELFWLSGDSFVEKNSSLPVFYNYTWINSTEEINMTASLVFRQVSEEDLSNNYTCKLQSDYETSFVTITLKQNEPFIPPVIISPKNNQEFDVDLDSTVVIDCKAVTSSDIDELFWLSGDSFVETDSTLPVFYNYTWVSNTEEINMTASLVFRQVSEEDLSNNYTCKLQSDYQTSFVTITLKQKVLRIFGLVKSPLEYSRIASYAVFDADKSALPKDTAMILSLIFITFLSGVCPQSPKEIRVKEGEIVAEYFNECDHNEILWSSFTKQGMHLHNNTPAAEHRQMGVMVQQGILVILSASDKHEGNYSCSLKNSSRRSWISLKVYKAQSRDSEQMNQISKECYTEESCNLDCPEKNVRFNTLNITRIGITWHKEGRSSPKDGYFPSVKKEDSGIYTCTRSYLYDGQIYNMTSTVKLDVQPNKITKKAVIISPENKQIFEVDLGSTVRIDCKAVMMSDTDELFWLSGDSFVKKDTSLPVFYNETWVNSREEINMTTSLIFRKVSEEDLSKNYTCKLQSDYETSYVTITLKQKASRSYTSLGVCFVIIIVVMFVTVVTYVKFKVDITLFLRDTLKWSGSISDGKSYDAFLMCYKCDTAGGLNPSDKRWLESVLEEKFGYSLCLYDRDILPGKAIADAVLDCVEQSRAVVLVPVSPDPDPESGLLSAIHEALVERQTRLVFITTETSMASKSDSFPEALQLLSKAGNCVTWKGISSMPTSSSFWKQLRYYLPAPQQAPTVKLLPQTIQDVTS